MCIYIYTQYWIINVRLANLGTLRQWIKEWVCSDVYHFTESPLRFPVKKILYIVCGDATTHQSFIPFHAWHCHRELIRKRNHPHRRQRGAWSGFYLFTAALSCPKNDYLPYIRLCPLWSSLRAPAFAPFVGVCQRYQGHVPLPTQRNFLGLIQPVASGNWAPQLCKAISAARTVREQCFLEARPGWEDKMVLCWGKWNIANPGQAQRHIASLSILVLWLRRP